MILSPFYTCILLISTISTLGGAWIFFKKNKKLDTKNILKITLILTFLGIFDFLTTMRFMINKGVEYEANEIVRVLVYKFGITKGLILHSFTNIFILFFVLCFIYFFDKEVINKHRTLKGLKPIKFYRIACISLIFVSIIIPIWNFFA